MWPRRRRCWDHRRGSAPPPLCQLPIAFHSPSLSGNSTMATFGHDARVATRTSLRPAPTNDVAVTGMWTERDQEHNLLECADEQRAQELEPAGQCQRLHRQSPLSAGCSQTCVLRESSHEKCRRAARCNCRCRTKGARRGLSARYAPARRQVSLFSPRATCYSPIATRAERLQRDSVL